MLKKYVHLYAHPHTQGCYKPDSAHPRPTALMEEATLTDNVQSNLLWQEWLHTWCNYENY